MASSRPLTLFPDLNDQSSSGPNVPAPTLPDLPGPSAPVLILPNLLGPSAPAPILPSFPMISVEQIMAAQSDVEANHFTLSSCMETVTVVTKLSHRLQTRTIEVQKLNSQLSLLQNMYRDARAEICALKAENKELKRKTTVMTRLGAPSYLTFDSQQGVISFGGPAYTEADPSKVNQRGVKSPGGPARTEAEPSKVSRSDKKRKGPVGESSK